MVASTVEGMEVRQVAARRRVLPRLSGVGRVWVLTATMYVTGLAVMVAYGGSADGVAAPVGIPWWALAVLFYLAEANVVHVHFRRDAQSFSLSEVPIVLGLFFASPADLVVGLMVGSTAALLFHRKQSRLKLAFNVSHFFLGVTLAILVFDRLVVADPLGPEGWSGAILATVVATLIGHAAITTALVVSGGQPEVDKLPQVLALGMTGTLTNTALGLVAVTVLWREPRAAWLLVVPAATLYFAYRAYTSERNKHESIEFLYESTRILHRSPEVDEAVLGLLAQARQMFRAERAEITLFPVKEGEPALRTSLGPGEASEAMARVPLDPSESRWADALGEEAILYPDGAAADPLVAALGERGIREAMVKVVRTEHRVVGTIVVANRLGETTNFDHADLMLFETLARNVGLVLENGRLEQSLEQLRRLEEQLKHQANHDPLTHLANRRLFQERAEVAFASYRRGAAPPAVLFVDLDDFKTINDSLGHVAGDQLLLIVGERISSVLRPTDLAARLGGDEFAVLLDGDGGDPTPAAQRVADRLLDAIGQPIALGGETVTVRPSIGIAVADGDCSGAADLLRNADVAMYTAKGAGKNCHATFETGMQVAVIERHELMADMQRAVQRDEFVLHYQPIVDLASGAIVATEALIRWHHPRRGLVSPAEFVPLAEETGLILPIGAIVLRKACEQAADWRRRFPQHRDLRMSVNLSARELQQPGFVAEVGRVIERSGVDPGALLLEITESVLMQDTEANIATLEGLKGLGVKLAMDDFGTGYSSLSYLARLPLDTLKVAKPFVDGLGRGERERAFAHAIVKLGQTVQLNLIAEGIERLDQLEELRALACDMGQGYFFGSPLPPERVEALLAGSPAAPAAGPRLTVAR